MPRQQNKSDDVHPEEIKVGGHTIEVTHPTRIYFPDPGLSKRDVVHFYAQVGDKMARYTRSRALSLRRFPRGVGEEGFFQKRVESYYPDWIARASLPIKEGELEYAVGDDAATFAWLSGIGAIEFHAMLSRIDKPKLPDQIIFDLDPPGDYTDEVRRTALGLKAICDDLGLTSFVKSTGSRGFHVILPVQREFGFDETRSFAKLLAGKLVAARPDRLSLEMRKANRQGRVLVDVWRNGDGQTAVAPFSLRARPGAPVAVPLRWDDLASPDVHPRAATLTDVCRDPAPWAERWPETLAPAPSIRAAWETLKEEERETGTD